MHPRLRYDLPECVCRSCVRLCGAISACPSDRMQPQRCAAEHIQRVLLRDAPRRPVDHGVEPLRRMLVLGRARRPRRRLDPWPDPVRGLKPCESPHPPHAHAPVRARARLRGRVCARGRAHVRVCACVDAHERGQACVRACVGHCCARVDGSSGLVRYRPNPTVLGAA